MHELQVTQSILEIVLEHARKHDARTVATVMLEVGLLNDLQEEWVQRYFDHLSKGTVAEGARLRVERVPAVFECGSCGESFRVTEFTADLACEQCGSKEITLVDGRRYHVKSMECF